MSLTPWTPTDGWPLPQQDLSPVPKVLRPSVPQFQSHTLFKTPPSHPGPQRRQKLLHVLLAWEQGKPAGRVDASPARACAALRARAGWGGTGRELRPVARKRSVLWRTVPASSNWLLAGVSLWPWVQMPAFEESFYWTLTGTSAWV